MLIVLKIVNKAFAQNWQQWTNLKHEIGHTKDNDINIGGIPNGSW